MRNLSKLSKPILLLPLLVAACSSQAVTEMASETTTATKTKPQDYLKPGASVRFTHDYDGLSQPGEIVTIRVKVFDEYPSGTLTVTLRDTPNIRLYSDVRDFEFDMSGEQVHEFEIQLESKTEGRHLLNIMAVAEPGNGHAIPRTRSIPIQVGEIIRDYKTKEISKQSSKSSGGVIAMEAEETIKKAE